MSATLPLFARGRDLSSISVAPVVVSALGVWTIGTAVSLKGYVDTVRLTVHQMLDTVTSLDSFYINRVVTATDFELQIVEKTRLATAAPSDDFVVGSAVIPQILIGTSYCQVIFSRGISGSSTKAETYTCYGAWESIADGFQGLSGQNMAVTIRQVDVTYGGSEIVPLSLAYS